jgi:hypothetical protein
LRNNSDLFRFYNAILFNNTGQLTFNISLIRVQLNMHQNWKHTENALDNLHIIDRPKWLGYKPYIGQSNCFMKYSKWNIKIKYSKWKHYMSNKIITSNLNHCELKYLLFLWSTSSNPNPLHIFVLIEVHRTTEKYQKCKRIRTRVLKMHTSKCLLNKYIHIY